MHLRPFSWNMYRKWQIPTDTLPLQSTKIRSLLQLHGKFEISLIALSYILFTIFHSNFHSWFSSWQKDTQSSRKWAFLNQSHLYLSSIWCLHCQFKVWRQHWPILTSWRLEAEDEVENQWSQLFEGKKKSFFLSKNWHFQENNERSFFHLVIHQSSQSWQHCAECSS